MLGTVRFYLEEKGYGFVANEGGDWFFHASAILGAAPEKGDTVEFWLADDRKSGNGLIAVDVTVRPAVS